MAQNKKPKSVAQLNRENKQLTKDLALAQQLLEDAAPTAKAATETIQLLKDERYSNWHRINDLQMQLVNIKNMSLPARRNQVLAIASGLSELAKESGIPVCLFIDKGDACEYFTTASAGQAIDMFANVAMQNPHAGTVMGHALSLAETLVQVSEN